MKRIVSLIASSTEMVAALGRESWLVGRSHECDYPPQVKQLPQCTEPKFQLDGTSYQIDQRLKAILQEGLGVYRVDADKLNALKPDVIITQIQCEVCAVSEKDVKDAVCAIIGSKPQIVALNPNALSDIWDDIRKVGDALDAKKEAEALIHSLNLRISAIHERAEKAESKRSIAYIEWIEPLMTGGNWMPELIHFAGAKNLFGEAGKHSPYLKWDELLKANPDVIVISPCGFDIARTKKEMPALTQKPEWKQLRAVKNGHVYLADGNQYFNRPGPRVVESLEALAEMIYPELFHFGHEGKGWERFVLV
jgi:iron complex transport system substrate-binding protein